MEEAAQDVRDKVSRVRGRLPEDIEEPVVAKQDADAQPFFWLALTAENYDLMQLSDIADRLVKARLQTVPGVAQRADLRRAALLDARVAVGAGAGRARAHGAGRRAARSAARNVEIPAGRIESERREFTVRSLGELQDAGGVRRPGGQQARAASW